MDRRRGAVLSLLLLTALLVLGVLADRGRRWAVEAARTAAQTAEQRGKVDDARHRLQLAWLLAPRSAATAVARLELEQRAGDFAHADARLADLASRALPADLAARRAIARAAVDLARYRVDEARQGADAAVTESRRIGRGDLEVAALKVVAEVAIAQDRPDAAAEALERASALAEASGLEGAQAETAALLGHLRWWVLDAVDDPRPRALEPALAVVRHLDERRREAVILDLLAHVSLRGDDLPTFFARQNEALDLWEAMGNRSRQARAHLDIGWAWDRLQNPRRAMRHLERALELAQASGDRLIEPRLERMLASAELTARRRPQAIDRLETLLSDPRPWFLEGRSIYGVLGDAHRRSGDSAQARRAYRQALKLDRLDDVSFRVWIGSGLARVALADGQTDEAGRLLAELEARVGPRSDWSDRRRVLSLRASVLEAGPTPSAALEPLLEAAEIETRSLGSLGRLTSEHGLGVLARLLPKLLASPTDAEPDLTASARAEEAFRLFEQARLRPERERRWARAELDQGSLDASKAEAEAFQAARRAAAQAAAGPSPERLAALRRAYALYEAEALRARSRRAPPAAIEAPTVAELQSGLRPGTAVLSYLLLRRAPVVFLLRPDRFEVIPLDFQPRELRPRIKVLRHQLEQRRGSGWRPPARALWRLLIGPVDAIGGLDGIDRLYIVPMGDLHTLPFAALLDADDRPLIQRTALATLPTASALGAPAREASGAGWVLAHDRFPDRRLPDLPAARREVSAVARRTGARQLVGAPFTEARFRALAPSAPFLHVVTHARIEPEMPMLSRLIVGAPPGDSDRGAENDGELTVRELLDLELRAELVTLSACRSGLAEPAARLPSAVVRRTGLIDAFRLAGARNVVGTLTPVEDRATATFMATFATELLDSPPIEALTAVQRRAAAGAVDGSPHPGHWSAFVLVGPGDRRLLGLAPATDSSVVSVED
ncbi:MAG: CHAT domain-containing protein [Acidobacteriota bacterium]